MVQTRIGGLKLGNREIYAHSIDSSEIVQTTEESDCECEHDYNLVKSECLSELLSGFSLNWCRGLYRLRLRLRFGLRLRLWLRCWIFIFLLLIVLLFVVVIIVIIIVVIVLHFSWCL